MIVAIVIHVTKYMREGSNSDQSLPRGFGHIANSLITSRNCRIVYSLSS